MKRYIVQALYWSGLLPLYHRLRNRHALTVISLHRILGSQDRRWQTCDPLYTMSDTLFDECLGFFARHYSVVSLADLEAARTAVRPLPPRPLLITFDDGWADNHQYALPLLQRRRLAAVLFVASDALNRNEAFFQERIISAWRRSILAPCDLTTLWTDMGLAPPEDVLAIASIRALIGKLQLLPGRRREQLLERLGAAFEDPERQMLTVDQLTDMANAGIGVGSHGKAHEPLTAVTDPCFELTESKSAIAAALKMNPGQVRSLSFPFSRQNAAVIELARKAGYELLFGGGLSLTPIRQAVPDLLARVAVDAGEVSDSRGKLQASVLAAYLFRRPHRCLVPG